jgi:phosphotransferase system HPr (HPr) family protein
MNHFHTESSLQKPVEKEFVITHSEGLNLLACQRIAMAANQLKSNIVLTYKNQDVNARDVFDLIGLGVCPGEHILLKACGPHSREDLLNFFTLVCPFCVHYRSCSRRARNNPKR